MPSPWPRRWLQTLLLGSGAALLACCSSPPPDDESPDSTEPITLVADSDSLALPPLRAYGISLVDYDDDGLADVTLAAVSGLYVFHNEGEWAFRDVTAELGLSGAAAPDLANSYAVVWVDVDDDGDLDLFVSRRLLPQDSGPGIHALRTPLLLRAQGGQLVDITAESGLAVEGSWEGAAFSDLDGDGRLDLVLTGGVDASGENNGEFGHTGSGGAMWRGLGDGTFERLDGAAACTGPEDSESWGVLALDVDGDGDQDVLQANDFIPATFCLNQGDGTFADGDELMPTLGSPMGLGAGDINGDGCLDIYATNFENPDNVLSFDGTGLVTDYYLSMVANGNDPSPTASGYGLSIQDADLDGDQDVLWVSAFESGVAQPGLSPGRLALARGGEGTANRRLVYASLGDEPTLAGSHNGYGMAHGDLDGDGDLDVAVSVDSEPRDDQGQPLTMPADFVDTTFLLRNDTPRDGRAWLSLRLEQDAPNRRAVGATVRIKVEGRVTARVVTAGSSFLSSHDYPLHFGLGHSDAPEWVHVRWPDGATQLITNLGAGARSLVRSAQACVPEGSCDGLVVPCVDIGAASR